MRKVIFISWALWIAACFLPCLILKTNSGERLEWNGLNCMLYGLFGFLFWQFELIANLFFMLSSFTLVSPYKKTGCASAVLAVLIASETFLLPPVKLWMDEGGVNSAHVVAFGPGLYLWYGSLLIVLVAVFARLGNKTQSQVTPVD